LLGFSPLAQVYACSQHFGVCWGAGLGAGGVSIVGVDGLEIDV